MYLLIKSLKQTDNLP